MKIKIALIGFFLIFQSQAQSKGKFNFLNDCIDVYSIMNKAQTQFNSSIFNNSNPKEIKSIAENCNSKLDKCIEKLNKFSNVSDIKIKKTLELIIPQIKLLIEHNEKYKDLTESNNLSKEIELLKMGQKFLLTPFNTLLLVPCSITVEKPENKNIHSVNSYLTLRERNLINQKLISDFGNLIINNVSEKNLSSFEKSARVTYQFLNDKLGYKIIYK